MILTHGSNSISRGDKNLVTIGGRDYPTVKIGSQWWLAENLDYKFSGCGIGGSDRTTPNAWYYDNNEATYGIDGAYKCGLLYNWYAANLLNSNRDALCPGWHVPSTTEWDTLATEVGGASIAGTKLKAKDNTVTSNWPSGWGGTDNYGFTALPSGGFFASFLALGSLSSFWTSTEYDSSTAYGRYLGVKASWTSSNYYMINGFSIRLVKDAT